MGGSSASYDHSGEVASFLADFDAADEDNKERHQWLGILLDT